MKIRQILKITGGKLLAGDPEKDIEPSSLSTDSRSIKRGGVFVALKGANFNGDDFIEDAFRKGASGAVTSRRTQPPRRRGAGFFIYAGDTLKAFQDIAAYHRRSLKIPVIGVTGSNGKTTVKDMAAKLLSTRYDVLENEGTQNNHIGVPATLLRLNRSHDICVLEMGMNHKGELSRLAGMAKPEAAVITNIGPSHLEFLGDLNGVFEAKREILASLGAGDTAFLNGDDDFLSMLTKEAFRIRRFGFRKWNDFRATSASNETGRTVFTLNGAFEFALRVLGAHNIYNALAAIAVAAHFGVTFEAMKKPLYDFRPRRMRLAPQAVNGIHIINDSYNSNPLSMEAALEALRDYPAGARWVVSADMMELGRDGLYFHRAVGKMVADSGANGLLTFGKFSKATLSAARKCGMDRKNLRHCSSHDEIAGILRKVLRRGDAVLVKGSRAMKMEEVVHKLSV